MSLSAKLNTPLATELCEWYGDCEEVRSQKHVSPVHHGLHP